MVWGIDLDRDQCVARTVDSAVVVSPERESDPRAKAFVAVGGAELAFGVGALAWRSRSSNSGCPMEHQTRPPGRLIIQGRPWGMSGA
jgi:hypothetical protein